MGRRHSNPLRALLVDIEKTRACTERITKYSERAVADIHPDYAHFGGSPIPVLTVVTTARAISVGLSAHLDELEALVRKALDFESSARSDYDATEGEQHGNS